jgi:hypothetical protein
MRGSDLGLGLAVIGALASMAGCTRGGGDADAGDVGRVVMGCEGELDSDGDGIADRVETDNDADGDGIGNRLDPDSDGDGVLDIDESRTGNPCAPANSDTDETQDYLDLDSDNDGLSDADEARLGTSPTNVDTDGDGVTDLAETAAETDPLDMASTIAPEDYFVVLPHMGDHVLRTLRFGTNIQQADVYFLVDSTGSMQPVIDNVRDSLGDIATELATVIPDVQMGVGNFEDFPFSSGSPFGPTFFGGPDDDAYENAQDITADLDAVRGALDGIVLGDGHDGPEAAVQGIYQTATGRGGMWSFMGSSYAIPRRTCPEFPDESVPRRGYPCFRPGSLPIVVTVTDLEWHAGSADGSRHPYSMNTPAPQDLPDAADALSSIGGRFVGVPIVNDSGMSFATDHEAMAMQTGSVDGSGDPLVYPAPSGAVSDSIIDGIRALVTTTPQDVNTDTENVAPNPGDVNATDFILSITPVAAAPMSGIRSMDATTFYDVTPGTAVDFQIDFYNGIVPPPPVAQVYRARIVVFGNYTARLDERRVFIIVPPDAGVILI